MREGFHPPVESTADKEKKFAKHPWIKKWLLGVLMSVSLTAAEPEGRPPDNQPTAEDSTTDEGGSKTQSLPDDEFLESIDDTVDNTVPAVPDTLAEEDKSLGCFDEVDEAQVQKPKPVKVLSMFEREIKSTDGVCVNEVNSAYENIREEIFQTRMKSTRAETKYFLDVLRNNRGLLSMVEQAAEKNDFDPDFILAMIANESGFQPNRVSDQGAVGYMQLMPHSARDAGIRVHNKIGRRYYWDKINGKNKLNTGRFNVSQDERLNPQKNIEAGCRLLRSYKKIFISDSLALVAYNEGFGNFTKRISAIWPQIKLTETKEFADKDLYKTLVDNGTINFADLYHAELNRGSSMEALDYPLKTLAFEEWIKENRPGSQDSPLVASAKGQENDG